MNERLKLQEIVDLLADSKNITKKEAESFLRELLLIITESIEQKDLVKIKDFGTFKVLPVEARKSVDVNTGEAIEIPAHYKLTFTPDKDFKEAVNKPFAHFETVLLEDGVTFENIEKEEFEENENTDNNTDVIADNVTQPEGDSVIGAALLGHVVQELKLEDVEPIQNVNNVAEQNNLTEEQIEAIESEELSVSDDEEVDTSETTLLETDEEHSIQQSPSSEQITQSEDDRAWNEEMYAEKKYRRERFIPWLVIAVILILILAFNFSSIKKLLGLSESDYVEAIPADSVLEENQPLDTAFQSVESPIEDSLEVSHTDNTNNKPAIEPAREENKTASVVTETIVPGQTLRLIALKHYGNRSFWVYIYQENPDKIKNPNNVPLGTRLIIPPASKYDIDPNNKESVEKARKMEADIFAKYQK